MRDELYHHGIRGQRWGFRRFQETDGSYTQAGKERYGIGKGLIDGVKEAAKDNRVRSEVAKTKQRVTKMVLESDEYKETVESIKNSHTYKKGKRVAEDVLRNYTLDMNLLDTGVLLANTLAADREVDDNG